MHAGPTNEEAIMEALGRLREELSQANYLNIGNLTSLSNSIQFLFSYAADAFTIISKQKRAIQRRLNFIQEQLRKHGLEFILEEKDQQQESNHSSSNTLNALNEHMQEVIIQKAELQGIRRESSTRKRNSNKFSRASTFEKKHNNRQQFNRATAFVREQLADTLEEDPTRTIELPKNAILNLYLRWSEKKGQTVNYQHLSSIQMALTNEIRRIFPNCTHNSRSFRGIQFQQKYAPLLKTDIKIEKQTVEEEDSPPLPSFSDDHLAV